MKFTVDKSFKKSDLKRVQALLLPVWLDSKGIASHSEAFSKLEKIDQKLVDEFLKSKAPKAGETKFLRLNKAPGYVLVACEKEMTVKRLIVLIRQFVRLCKWDNLKSAGIYIDDFSAKGGSAPARGGQAGGESLTPERVAQLVAENALLAHFDFAEEFKTKPKEGWRFVKEVILFTEHEGKMVKEAVTAGEISGEATNRARVLANYPPADITPEGVAEAARQVGKELPAVKVTVWDEKKLKSEGMNAILAVGKGSATPPRLIAMEYFGGAKNEKPIALVGKGVTFDSGGLNIKPGESMTDMHMDMSGGAAVIYALWAIAKLKLPVNVMGFVPAVENMPSGVSYHQQDIIKAYGGKTIEIGNTDAEGRVILADAIEYAKTKKPAVIVTIATLTGSAVSALGQRMSALFVKNNQELENALRKVGDVSGDLVWPLPLWDEHENDVVGNFADVTNTSKNGTRYGWALLAAGFLSHFAKGANFAHIDMAPRMTALTDEEQLSKGAAGFGVRYFVELVRQWANIKTLLK